MGEHCFRHVSIIDRSFLLTGTHQVKPLRISVDKCDFSVSLGCAGQAEFFDQGLVLLLSSRNRLGHNVRN